MHKGQKPAKAKTSGLSSAFISSLTFQSEKSFQGNTVKDVKRKGANDAYSQLNPRAIVANVPTKYYHFWLVHCFETVSRPVRTWVTSLDKTFFQRVEHIRKSNCR